MFSRTDHQEKQTELKKQTPQALLIKGFGFGARIGCGSRAGTA